MGIDGHRVFGEKLPSIFPRLVFEKRIEEIRAISNYLEMSTEDIANRLLCKILPKLLIDVELQDDKDHTMWDWLVKEVYKGKRKFPDLLQHNPLYLVNELVMICGSGLPECQPKGSRNELQC